MFLHFAAFVSCFFCCFCLTPRSLELARCSKLLSHQKVFLSPSIKPPPTEMADILRCSGGEVLTTLPHPPGVGLLIVASPDDLSMLSVAMEGGAEVHSTEVILGGVLRQELDLTAYPTHTALFIGNILFRNFLSSNSVGLCV